MRRRAPRPIGATLGAVLERTAPATVIARVQQRWPIAVGEAIAAESEPVSERDGIVTVGCRSAVWAEELSLLAPALLERLNESMSGRAGDPPIRGLSFVTRTRARGP